MEIALGVLTVAVIGYLIYRAVVMHNNNRTGR